MNVEVFYHAELKRQCVEEGATSARVPRAQTKLTVWSAPDRGCHESTTPVLAQ
jgi:hypothetical protein